MFHTYIVNLQCKVRIEGDSMRRAVLAAAVGLVLLVLFIGGWVFYLSWSACLGGERTALQEFRHYAAPESGPSPLMGTCQVRYTTKASRREVLGYYDERLRQNGWDVLGYEAHHPRKREVGGEYDTLSGALKTPKSAGAGLAARRNGYNYWVSYEPPSKEDPDLPDNRALVMVSVVEGGRPGAFRD
jgi:hypothetical protein